MEHFADRLMEGIRRTRAAVCVGLDPLLDRLPSVLRGMAGESPTDALLEYGRGVIQAVAPWVPAIKINIAFFEPFHEEGLRVYRQLTAESHAAGLLVIGDVKRADIGHTSTQYALAHLGGGDPATPDAVTVNPYFGSEGVEPFIRVAGETGRGVFVLVQTSNASASQVQGLTLPDGLTVCQRVAQLVEEWASPPERIGQAGYSCVGAVVSPRDLPSTVRIRELMPHCIFLVPGFGAQGRTAEEVAKCFKPDGSGALVAASRSVIYAYEDEKFRGRDWQPSVSQACQEFVDTIRALAR